MLELVARSLVGWQNIFISVLGQHPQCQFSSGCSGSGPSAVNHFPGMAPQPADCTHGQKDFPDEHCFLLLLSTAQLLHLWLARRNLHHNLQRQSKVVGFLSEIYQLRSFFSGPLDTDLYIQHSFHHQTAHHSTEFKKHASQKQHHALYKIRHECSETTPFSEH